MATSVAVVTYPNGFNITHETEANRYVSFSSNVTIAPVTNNVRFGQKPQVAQVAQRQQVQSQIAIPSNLTYKSDLKHNTCNNNHHALKSHRFVRCSINSPSKSCGNDSDNSSNAGSNLNKYNKTNKRHMHYTGRSNCTNNACNYIPNNGNNSSSNSNSNTNINNSKNSMEAACVSRAMLKLRNHHIKNRKYWNIKDCAINDKFAHTSPVYEGEELLNLFNKKQDINTSIHASEIPNNLFGMDRYLVENDGHRLGNTLQGAVYSAIDFNTGRRVIIKRSKKYLVERHCTRKGFHIDEDVRNEAKLLQSVSHDFSDSGISKFVDFFEDNGHYYLITEHGGTEFFSYVSKMHDIMEQMPSLANEWKIHARYHFRKLARSVYFLHTHCDLAHLDLSLENTVIDTIGNDIKNDDAICRIIDFGLAKQLDENHNGNWKYNKVVGKVPYQSPEMRRLYQLRKKGFSVTEKDYFDARKADIWALGVMLFIMLTGGKPWHVAELSEISFEYIMEGNMQFVLNEWGCRNLVDHDAFDLLEKIFKYESERIDITGILNHKYVDCAPRTLKKINLEY